MTHHSFFDASLETNIRISGNLGSPKNTVTNHPEYNNYASTRCHITNSFAKVLIYFNVIIIAIPMRKSWNDKRISLTIKSHLITRE